MWSSRETTGRKTPVRASGKSGPTLPPRVSRSQEPAACSPRTTTSRARAPGPGSGPSTISAGSWTSWPSSRPSTSSWCPRAVGRPRAVDGSELARSVAALRSCGEAFAASGIRAAIEPIRAAEVSLVHSVAEAVAYIEAVGHPAIGHINADVYHMSLEEAHIGEAILAAGPRLANLHLADTNRDALGTANLDPRYGDHGLLSRGHERGRSLPHSRTPGSLPRPLCPGQWPLRQGSDGRARGADRGLLPAEGGGREVPRESLSRHAQGF